MLKDAISAGLVSKAWLRGLRSGNHSPERLARFAGNVANWAPGANARANEALRSHVASNPLPPTAPQNWLSTLTGGSKTLDPSLKGYLDSAFGTNTDYTILPNRRLNESFGGVKRVGDKLQQVVQAPRNASLLLHETGHAATGPAMAKHMLPAVLDDGSRRKLLLEQVANHSVRQNLAKLKGTPFETSPADWWTQQKRQMETYRTQELGQVASKAHIRNTLPQGRAAATDALKGIQAQELKHTKTWLPKSLLRHDPSASQQYINKIRRGSNVTNEVSTRLRPLTSALGFDQDLS